MSLFNAMYQKATKSVLLLKSKRKIILLANDINAIKETNQFNKSYNFILSLKNKSKGLMNNT